MLAYFPREKLYYKGGWEKFLLGNEQGEIRGLDSLFFGILSLQAMLIHLEKGMPAITSQDGRRWTLRDSLGNWQREHIFTSRGRRSKIRWYSKNLDLEVTAKMDKQVRADLLPKTISLSYPSENIEAVFEIKAAVLNTSIPPEKVNFVVPKDAALYEER